MHALASRVPVHEELHADVSLPFELNDDGGSLAAQLRSLARESCLWTPLSQAGLQNAGSSRLTVSAVISSNY